MRHDDDDKPDVQELLLLAADGDEDAWREIIERYTSRVFGLLRAQCGDPDLAEEITQNTFCRIAAKIGSYSEAGKFEAWLFRIAMNLLRDEMRRRKRHAMPTENQALIGLAGAGNAGAEMRADEQELAALREAVSRLSDAEQQVIHLRHHAELSFKQIAEMTDQPIGTVLARHHRALKKLHEQLGGTGDIAGE
jgi:RNA polymerase sigma-70 factor, ECF subfamily